MSYTSELNAFKKSFLLHSSRYNLYNHETLVKGSTATHNRAVTALGKLEDKVIADKTIYSDLLAELLQSNDPKVCLCASFVCLRANIHTDKAMNNLLSIANSTPGISMICDFDIRGTITMFRKKQMDMRPRNDVDAIADKMKKPSEGETTDKELWDLILKLENIDAVGHDGRTLLIHACIFGRVELVRKLIEKGVDINKKDAYQKTALHCASIVGNIEEIEILLNNQVNVNAQERNGFTALDFVNSNPAQLSQKELEEQKKLLISYGAKTKMELLSER